MTSNSASTVGILFSSWSVADIIIVKHSIYKAAIDCAPDSLFGRIYVSDCSVHI